jgi:hypothetical protein
MRALQSWLSNIEADFQFTELRQRLESDSRFLGTVFFQFCVAPSPSLCRKLVHITMVFKLTTNTFVQTTWIRHHKAPKLSQNTEIQIWCTSEFSQPNIEPHFLLVAYGFGGFPPNKFCSHMVILQVCHSNHNSTSSRAPSGENPFHLMPWLRVL